MNQTKTASIWSFNFQVWLARTHPDIRLTADQLEVVQILGRTRLFSWNSRGAGKTFLFNLLNEYDQAGRAHNVLYEAHGPTPDGYAGVRLVADPYPQDLPSDSNQPPPAEA